MPSVGIGGFSFAYHSTDGGYPSITIGSGGTWVYVASSSTNSSPNNTITKIGRVAGGSSVEGRFPSDSGHPSSVYVIAWRIA